jgi:hypothetical protein
MYTSSCSFTYRITYFQLNLKMQPTSIPAIPLTARTLSPGDGVTIRTRDGSETETFVSEISIDQITLENGWHILEGSHGYYVKEWANVDTIRFSATNGNVITTDYSLGDIIHVTGLGSNVSYRVPIDTITTTRLRGDNTTITFKDGKPVLLGDINTLGNPNKYHITITKKPKIIDIPEVAHLVYSHLDPKSLARVGSVSGVIGTRDDIVWKAKVDADFTGMTQYKPDDITYYQQYKELHEMNTRPEGKLLLNNHYDKSRLIQYIIKDRLDLISFTNALDIVASDGMLLIEAIQTIIDNNRLNIFKILLVKTVDYSDRVYITYRIVSVYKAYILFTLAVLDLHDIAWSTLICEALIVHHLPDVIITVVSHYDNPKGSILNQTLSNWAVMKGEYIQMRHIYHIQLAMMR